MKLKNIVYALFVVITFSACKTKTVIAEDQEKTLTISVKFMEIHCGGAEQTEEENELNSDFRPFTNGVVYISQFNGHESVINEQSIALDKAGFAKIQLDSGYYVISFYSLVPPEDPTENVLDPSDIQDDPEPPTEGLTDEYIKEDCEWRWKMMMATPFKIVGGQTAYQFSMMKDCNPCELPRP
jgi:hypothetical protein